MVISGSLALVDRGVLKHDEAVIHYRLERANENYICQIVIFVILLQYLGLYAIHIQIY